MHALFRENHYLEVSTTANNRIRVSAAEPKISKQILVLSILLNKKSILEAHLVNPVAVDGVLSLFSAQNNHLLNLPINSVYQTNNQSEQYLDGLEETSQFLTVSSIS